jgi:Protein of unknown function (DUF3567)
MHMLYNSDNFAVVRFELEPAVAGAQVGPEPVASQPIGRGGYEIVDKTVRREIYIEGALAERFQQGVQALVETGEATEEKFDAYIAGFADAAQQPVVLH